MANALDLRDEDHGAAALVQRVFGIAKPTITVGILEGDEPHGDDPVSILEVAVWNEFGTATAPARSFIRAYFDENEAALREDLTKLLQSVVLGRRTKEQALELLALHIVGQIQARMAAGIDPPNAPSTIARKGSSTPLIGITGILRSSVTYKVTP
jgi:hypothetical protein